MTQMERHLHLLTPLWWLCPPILLQKSIHSLLGGHLQLSSLLVRAVPSVPLVGLQPTVYRIIPSVEFLIKHWETMAVQPRFRDVRETITEGVDSFKKTVSQG